MEIMANSWNKIINLRNTIKKSIDFYDTSIWKVYRVEKETRKKMVQN